MATKVPWVAADSETDPCCCNPNCCLYDHVGYLDSSYALTDLPDTIELRAGGGHSSGDNYTWDAGDVVLNRTDAVYVYTGTATVQRHEDIGGGDYADPVDATVSFQVISDDSGGPYGEGWRFVMYDIYANTYEYTRNGCLIDGLSEYADQFADTYSVGGDTVTRESLCVWSGSKTGGGVWTLSYGISLAYKWNLTSSGPTPTDDDKTDPQSSPAGTYGSFTVS